MVFYALRSKLMSSTLRVFCLMVVYQRIGVSYMRKSKKRNELPVLFSRKKASGTRSKSNPPPPPQNLV
jgi:hypothetical protein